MVAGLKRLSESITILNGQDRELLPRTKAIKRLNSLSDAALNLKKMLADPLVISLLNRASDSPIPDNVWRAWGCLEEISERAKKAVKMQGTGPGAGRSEFPGRLKARDFCALVVSEGFDLFGTGRPVASNKTAHEAAELLWIASVGSDDSSRKNGWGNTLEGWTRNFRSARMADPLLTAHVREHLCFQEE